MEYCARYLESTLKAPRNYLESTSKCIGRYIVLARRCRDLIWAPAHQGVPLPSLGHHPVLCSQEFTCAAEQEHCATVWYNVQLRYNVVPICAVHMSGAHCTIV